MSFNKGGSSCNYNMFEMPKENTTESYRLTNLTHKNSTTDVLDTTPQASNTMQQQPVKSCNFSSQSKMDTLSVPSTSRSGAGSSLTRRSFDGASSGEQNQVINKATCLFDDKPQETVCPKCSQNIITTTKHEVGLLSWIVTVGVGCLGCFLGCCFIPLCMSEFKNVRHICPECYDTVGVFKPIQ